LTAGLHGMDISDGDLARLARDGDPVAFRLLERRSSSRQAVSW
jgi:hypothetical protein